jgi:asparagine synthase (glutamine-hydrolysing)
LSALVHLIHNKGYVWQQQNNFYFKGTPAFSPFEPNENNAADFLIRYQSGFVWIYEDDTQIAAATDTIRSFPLFYYFDNQNFCLSDDAYLLKDMFSAAFNQAGIDIFKENGYTLENYTLAENIFVLQPTEFLHYDKESGKLSLKNYKTQIPPLAIDQYENKFEQLSYQIFDRVIEKLNGRKAIIPLSGGMDSRFILAALVQKKYPQICCYTYGKKGSYEAELAAKICHQLGVEWHFIEYSPEIFKSYLTENAFEYELYASQLTAIAHEQDYFAVEILKSKQLLQQDGVFIPGFSADLPAGSKVPLPAEWNNINISKEGLNHYIVQKYFEGKSFDFQIDLSPENRTDWVKAHEAWFTRNKVSKFVTNAIRCYEFFGHEWVLPFWDLDFIRFWEEMPLELRTNRKFYREFLHKHYFSPLSIDFDNTTVDETLAGNPFINTLKHKIPAPLKEVAKKVLLKSSEQDVNNLKHFADLLCKDAQLNPTDYKDENQAHAAWLLRKLNAQDR